MDRQGRLTAAQIGKMIERIRQKEELPEFAGTTLFFLERKRRALMRQKKR